jgi:hypothetical protein
MAGVLNGPGGLEEYAEAPEALKAGVARSSSMIARQCLMIGTQQKCENSAKR